MLDPRALHRVLRLSARQLRRSPASAVYGALTLAIGFGAATSIYSVIQGFTAPLPVPDGEEVVQVQVLDPRDGPTAPTAAEVAAWQEGSRSLEVGAFSTSRRAVHASDRPPRVAETASVTPGVFALLRVRPLLGRLPTSREGQPVALLSTRLWRDWLEGDPDAVGRQIRLGDAFHTVIGILPEGFHFPYRQDLWTVRGLDEPRWSAIEVVARLRDGSDPEAAEEELQSILHRSRRESGGPPSPARVRVAGFTDERGEGGEVTILLGVLLLVLALIFVSCANVANLLLERAVARARSLAIHQALGARPGEIMLQVLTEALLVAFLGLLPGLLIAQAVVWFVEATLGDHWGYYWMHVGLQPPALGFAAALALVTAAVSGALPALRARRLPISLLLQQEATSHRGRRKSWLSRALVTGQIACSCIGVVAAVLMGMGLAKDRRVVPSVPLDALHWTSLTFDGDRYAEEAARRTYRQRVLRELATEPVIRAAALSTGLPGVRAQVRTLHVVGRAPQTEPPTVLTSAVSPEFFDVFGLPVLRGRALRPADADSAVAVVSEDFVRLYLDRGEAVGRTIRLGAADGERDFRIVGVVGNLAIYESDRDRDLDQVYVPIDQMESAASYLIVRSAADDPQRLVTAVARSGQAADPEVPIGTVSPLSEVLAYVRQFMETLGILAVLGGLGAVVVVTIGLYGLVAFNVRQRISDFALRLALGAGSGEVLRGVVSHGLLLVLPGVALGLGATYLVTPLLGIFLGRADSHDPLVFGGAVAVYVLVALLATAGPARRAAFCNPAEVLRDE